MTIPWLVDGDQSLGARKSGGSWSSSSSFLPSGGGSNIWKTQAICIRYYYLGTSKSSYSRGYGEGSIPGRPHRVLLFAALTEHALSTLGHFFMAGSFRFHEGNSWVACGLHTGTLTQAVAAPGVPTYKTLPAKRLGFFPFCLRSHYCPLSKQRKREGGDDKNSRQLCSISSSERSLWLCQPLWVTCLLNLGAWSEQDVLLLRALWSCAVCGGWRISGLWSFWA